MKKWIYKYLMILTILLTCMLYIIACKYEVLDSSGTQLVNNVFEQDGSELTLVKDSISVSDITKIGTKYPLDKMYKVEEEMAYLYSLSYKKNNLSVGNTLNKRGYASDQLVLLFRESYPNVSIEDMGLNTIEEAYMATQLAIWEVSARTGEAREYTELSFIDSIKDDMGLKYINVSVFKKAKELVNYVENYHTDDTSTLLVPNTIIDSSQLNDAITKIDDDYVLGPFSITLQVAILTDIEVKVMNELGEEISSQVVNKDGLKIQNLTNQSEFYVRFPKEYKDININIKLNFKRLTPMIYETSSADFIANTYIIDSTETDLPFIISS